LQDLSAVPPARSGREPSAPEAALPAELRRALVSLAIGLAVLFAIVIVLGVAFRAPLEALGSELVARFGYEGIAFGVFVADCFTFPLPADFYLWAGVAAGGNPAGIIAAGSAGSIVGGMGAYHLGKGLAATRWFRRRVAAVRRRYPWLVGRVGLGAVIVAALTPVPFSVVCMLAGSLRMRMRTFLLATLFRIPRIAGYYAVIYLGWTL
jgi:membrane protein YqaA with SNARE-associated domain